MRQTLREYGCRDWRLTFLEPPSRAGRVESRSVWCGWPTPCTPEALPTDGTRCCFSPSPCERLFSRAPSREGVGFEGPQLTAVILNSKRVMRGVGLEWNSSLCGHQERGKVMPRISCHLSWRAQRCALCRVRDAMCWTGDRTAPRQSHVPPAPGVLREAWPVSTGLVTFAKIITQPLNVFKACHWCGLIADFSFFFFKFGKSGMQFNLTFDVFITG